MRRLIAAFALALTLGTVPIHAVWMLQRDTICYVDAYWINDFDCPYGSFKRTLWNILSGWD